ncbi:hypothetical protein AGABI2DRAFT_154321 [Agaricus bisporus var. bisporus H97]|uniref:hypothetical protein n=1 Tax=Agaricus bisporus var. bisporus (strain H97 / ATCC MYA-4626 / FGSC 10389) TaxID=936046 RepID=UPI00029F6D39|nr:hypothetical protein AGABI2DRAFT_154321 [Agaricus bisporus var. bisporus H97]EKV42506.1 hypothetical protein AGABI2DRAFT_154321 [Agaricus bisporus var. bisporus H97]
MSQETKCNANARILPDCWGHRGASARFPENTLVSFEAAARDGAEGFESDVHVSADDVVLMFHDSSLERTTDSTGKIKDRNWYGPQGMEHVRTIREPRQPIPTFTQTIELLMRPENQHIKFNVDVKPHNNPERLFKLMNETIVAQPSWQTVLAPRIVLGLWHPKFLKPAKEILPYCRRTNLGGNLAIARKYFWNDVHGFSILFDTLTSSDGQRFIGECQRAGKTLIVWTVNEPAEMMEAMRWGVDAIITDTTNVYLDLRVELQNNYEKTASRYARFFLWTTLRFYYPFAMHTINQMQAQVEQAAGPFHEF